MCSVVTFSATYGFAVDSDAGEINFYKNGALAGSATLPVDVDEWIAATSLYKNQSVVGQIIFSWYNFGQQPTDYAPPSGYEWLQTANYPIAPIPDGRDHFQVITDTGANILSAAQAAFPNGLYWIKRLDSANQHQLLLTG